MYVYNQRAVIDLSLSPVLRSLRSKVYSWACRRECRSPSICSRFKIVHRQREFINCCWFLNWQTELPGPLPREVSTNHHGHILQCGQLSSMRWFLLHPSKQFSLPFLRMSHVDNRTDRNYEDVDYADYGNI